jgi:hypothetical protein
MSFFFTAAFPSDSRTLSPALLFNTDLSFLTRGYLLLALFEHSGLVDFAMLVLLTLVASWYIVVTRFRAITFVHAIDVLS